VPLHVGYPITVGLAVLGVQIVGARVIFHEPIVPAQWLGTLLIVLGIMLIGGRGHLRIVGLCKAFTSRLSLHLLAYDAHQSF